MSIQSEITRISNNIKNALNIIKSAGISVADSANSDNLPGLVDELANADIDCGGFSDAATTGDIDAGAF